MVLQQTHPSTPPTCSSYLSLPMLMLLEECPVEMRSTWKRSHLSPGAGEALAVAFASMNNQVNLRDKRKFLNRCDQSDRSRQLSNWIPMPLSISISRLNLIVAKVADAHKLQATFVQRQDVIKHDSYDDHLRGTFQSSLLADTQTERDIHER